MKKRGLATGGPPPAGYPPAGAPGYPPQGPAQTSPGVKRAPCHFDSRTSDAHAAPLEQFSLFCPFLDSDATMQRSPSWHHHFPSYSCNEDQAFHFFFLITKKKHKNALAEHSCEFGAKHVYFGTLIMEVALLGPVAFLHGPNCEKGAYHNHAMLIKQNPFTGGPSFMAFITVQTRLYMHWLMQMLQICKRSAFGQSQDRRLHLD